MIQDRSFPQFADFREFSDFPQFVDFLKAQLARPLPGQVAQFQMAPLSGRQPEMGSISAKTCREAAVLALFYPCSKGRPKLLLTERPEGMTQHAGQVAFPGGRRENNEELEQTALRETEEEVLIDRKTIQICGQLTPLYVLPSDFCVYPFVGIVLDRHDMTIQTEEVAHVFGVRYRDLLDAEQRSVKVLSLLGKDRKVPHFTFGGRFVWGATAMMLAELAAVLDPELLELQTTL